MNLKALLRMYMIVTAFTTILFVLLGLSGVFQQVIQPPESATVGRVAAIVSDELFVEALNSELPAFTSITTNVSQWKFVRFVFEWITQMNPIEPRTYLTGAIPGMSKQDAILLHAPSPQAQGDTPFDLIPPEEGVKPDQSKSEKQEMPAELPTKQNNPVDSKRKSIFIYHSHNRESWLPELKSIKNPDMAYHEKLNITLVGQRLANRLQEKGVGSTIAKDDYPTQVEGFKFTRSYTYSLKTIQEAIARNGSYDFYFDIHRDSQPRNRTTLTYNKQTYAQVYFVVGGKNPAWRKNYQFARRIHDGLERRMPGLSKSIYAKSSNGNGLYNQSISENSALIEIGGPYNTLAECYRTADILADVISEIYYEAVETKGDS